MYTRGYRYSYVAEGGAMSANAPALRKYRALCVCAQKNISLKKVKKYI